MTEKRKCAECGGKGYIEETTGRYTCHVCGGTKCHGDGSHLEAMRAALELAAPEYCSNRCPSHGRTADGPLPHSEGCKQIRAALGVNAEKTTTGE